MIDAEFEQAIGVDDLRSMFQTFLPDTSQQEIAATLALFLEEQPPDITIADDGGVTDNSYTPEEGAAYMAYIDKLKAFAGEAYTELRQKRSVH